ncbi:MAG: hypothetical protein D6775_17105 [Caldilineae bacterium]|nr:MAG: hypothetical protein D6775_17105 [Caldilineae bacterium]
MGVTTMKETNASVRFDIWTSGSLVWPALFALLNVGLSIVANSSFRLSATSSSWRGFLAWQVAGNLAGFLSVLALTGLLRLVPLHVAYPITAGLTVVGVQVVAARWFFGEVISPSQWLGAMCVVVGIVLIGRR